MKDFMCKWYWFNLIPGKTWERSAYISPYCSLFVAILMVILGLSGCAMKPMNVTLAAELNGHHTESSDSPTKTLRERTAPLFDNLASATMAGNSKLAIEAARHTALHADQRKMRERGYGTLQHYSVMPLYTLTRFGKWDEILAERSPLFDLRYPRGVWHYARGMALTAKGQLKEARREWVMLSAIASSPDLEKVTIWDLNNAASLLKIASEVLAGELAAQQGNYQQAIAHLETAVNLQAQLKYDEPETWYYPVRQSLGAILLQANRAAEAETVYREDLKHHPENGWSLFGLAQSLRAQGKIEEAAAVQKRFEKAWQYADITLPQMIQK